MKHFIKYTIIILASLTSIFGLAQEPPPVIDLPTIVDPETGETIGGGTMIGDIIHANGKIFAYGAHGISVFDDDNSDDYVYNLLAKIPFGTTSEFGKFNPVYFHETFGSPDQTMMVFNENATNKYIYAIAPDLKILVINTEDPYESWTIELPVIGTEKLNDILDSQSGVVIMRYDDNNDRLYLLVASRDPDGLLADPPIGNFHVQKTVFGIYDVDPAVLPNSADHISLHYSEICAPGSVQEHIYGDQVVNFVFNERNDYFYLQRLGQTQNHEPDNTSQTIVEVREFDASGGTNFKKTIKLRNDFGEIKGRGYYKMGKMLYINDNGTDHDVHKIMVFPLRFFSNTDDFIPQPKFWVIDGNNYNTEPEFVVFEKQIIRDAIYLEEHEDLVLSFAPESNGNTENEHLAVFRYDPDPGPEEELFELKQEFPADNTTVTSPYDLNVALHLTKLNSNAAFVSNKDGISKIVCDNTSYNYTHLATDFESNFIRKGVLTTDRVFFNNTVTNGLEIYNIGNGLLETTNIRTGYPVYNIEANADGSNMYFYNKLNAHNIGFYSHQIPANPEEDVTTTLINIETAIGDIIYNPYQDHFLVSKFEPGNAEIQIYNASDNTGQGIIPLAGAEFAKEMFMAPNGNLYVCANMNNSDSHNPEIFIIDANDYISINSYDEVGDFPAFQDEDENDKPFAYYKASFDYNADNESVYISMAIQDLQKLPYNSQASSLFNIIDPVNPADPPPGKIIVLNDNSTKVNLSHFPGKVICPGSDNSSSQFKDKLFIAGEQFYEYDYETAPLPEDGDEDDFIIHDYYFLDMVYSPFHDRIFAIKENTLSNSEHRTFEIWTIDYNETVDINQLDFNEQPDGQIASLFYNPYDKRIYVYQKIDGAKLGAQEVKLLSFDPDAPTPEWTATSLGFASYFPEYDHTCDDAQFWYYNMTTPYISPISNLIYLPNGGHSCVSKVPFTANEALALKPAVKNDDDIYISLTWLSFPRLDRSIGGDIPVNFVLGGDNIVLEDYEEGSKLQNLPLTEDEYIHNYYSGTLWPDVQGVGLRYIHSELGYKLQLDYGTDPSQTDNNWLFLSGTVLDPNVTVNVSPNEHENWEGYWLYQSQSPFDAIPDEVLDQLTYMEAQDWACMKRTGSYKDNQQPTWICSVHTGTGQIGKVSLDYGDMVILESGASVSISFQWLSTSNPPEEKIKPNVEYYQFTEQLDYTSFFIELDSTENPQEIAAFVEDSCVGATSVLPEDTIVLVAGYMEGMEGEVTFEEYYGSEKSTMPPIQSYLVNSLDTDTWVKRTIQTAERQGYYLLSFKKQEEENVPEVVELFSIWPNPVTTSINCQFEIETDALVSLELLDVTGRALVQWLNEFLSEGGHRFRFDLTASAGNKLKPGIYFIRFKAGVKMETKKLIVK